MSYTNVSSEVDNDPYAALRRSLEEQKGRERAEGPKLRPDGTIEPKDPGAPPAPGGPGGPKGVHSKAVSNGPFMEGEDPSIRDNTVHAVAPGTEGAEGVHLDAPVLPDPKGKTAPPKELNRLAQMGSSDYFDTGNLVFLALQVMTDANHQDQTTASRLKRNMENSKITEKKNELDATKDRIEGERKSALTKFISATAGAVCSMGFGFYGSHMQFQNPDKTQNVNMQMRQAQGAMLQAGGQAIGNVVDQFGQLVDKTMGGQRQADEASIREKDAAIFQEVYQQGADAANSWLDAIKEQRKKAQQTLMDYVDRQKQAVDAVWR